MSACLFCRIVTKDVPAQIVAATPEVLAFKDVNPQAPTHLLIIPTRHVASVTGLTDQDAGLLMQMMRMANQLAEASGLASRGFRLVVNSGAEAGQSVAHLHWHLLGGRPMRWPPG